VTATVAQFKKFPFGVNIPIEVKYIILSSIRVVTPNEF
jgi:hypothetical protein